MPDNQIFVAYPSIPEQLGNTIEEAIKNLVKSPYNFNVKSWKQLDIPGRLFVEGIIEKVDNSFYVIADTWYMPGHRLPNSKGKLCQDIVYL